MSRTEASLKKALEEIPALVEEFERDVRVPADSDFNKYLELAMRTKDFLELAQLMARDALEREESCGGHFREEYQTPEGEALRNDDDFTYVSAWEWKGKADAHQLHKEPLVFENVKLTQRSYK
jgi:succinate dehydrogenase / fumarate reductase flavoprotein subunit